MTQSIVGIVSEEHFRNLLQERLGIHFERALQIFKDYGENCSFDVTNVLLHATEHGKIEMVLETLEEHYRKHLQFQHPKIRGTVSGAFCNPTELMFRCICVDSLGLQPAQ